MAKILLSEAAKLVPVSKPTLYRHVQENKFSWDKDSQGHKVVDPAELQRFYGTLKNPDNLNENTQQDSSRKNDNSEILAVFRAENAHLKQEVEGLQQDKQDLKVERNKLLGIVENQTSLLEDKREKVEKTEDHQPKPESRWLVYTLVGLTMLVSLGSIAVIVWLLQTGA